MVAIRGAPLGINSLAAGFGALWHVEKTDSYLESTLPHHTQSRKRMYLSPLGNAKSTKITEQ